MIGMIGRQRQTGTAAVARLPFASTVTISTLPFCAGLLAAETRPGAARMLLAAPNIIWFAAVVLYDVAALGAASFLPSGLASRLLIISVLVNPVDAVRTGALLGAEGTSAFGSASLAFFRFTQGPRNAGLLLAASFLLWIVLPALLAVIRLRRADL